VCEKPWRYPFATARRTARHSAPMRRRPKSSGFPLIRLGAIDATAHRCNNRHYLPVFTKSKIWSVSRVSAVLIE
jgi:hypothetical protein